MVVQVKTDIRIEAVASIIDGVNEIRKKAIVAVLVV